LGTRGAAVRGVNPLPLGMPGHRTDHQSGLWTLGSGRWTIVLPQARGQYLICCCVFSFCNQRLGLRHLVYRSLDICSSNLPMTMLSLCAFPGSNEIARSQAIFTVAASPRWCHPYCRSSSCSLSVRARGYCCHLLDVATNVADGHVSPRQYVQSASSTFTIQSVHHPAATVGKASDYVY